MTVWYALGALVAGIPTAWAFGRYMASFAACQPIRAGLWDVAIIVLAQVVALTLWSQSNDSPLVMLGWAIGNGLGTYLVTPRERI